jgi:hypothetical protein
VGGLWQRFTHWYLHPVEQTDSEWAGGKLAWLWLLITNLVLRLIIAVVPLLVIIRLIVDHKM